MRVRIDGRASPRQFAFGRRHQHLGGEGGIVLGPRQHIADSVEIDRSARGAPPFAARHLQHDLRRQRLARFPAVEGVAVLAHQAARALPVVRRPENRRRGKVAAQRQKRLFRHIHEDEASAAASVSSSTRFVGPACVLAFQGQRQARVRSVPTKPMRTGMCMGFFSGWPGVGRERSGVRSACSAAFAAS